MQLLILLVLPIIIGLVAMVCSNKKITLKEFLLMEAITVAIVGAGYAIARYTPTGDTEIISGRIVGRSKDRVSCEHSYQCHCRTVTSGFGNNQTTSTVCDTCYDHSYDIDWNLQVNGGLSGIIINRVDRQGLDMPDRWAKAFIGEPVAEEHHFDNYIRANPNSLLRRSVDLTKFQIPNYPNETYDYYRVNRFLPIGFKEQYFTEWNWLLNEVNGDLGPAKHANVIVVAVKSANEDYEYALEDSWVLGKKNDIIVLLGVPEYPKIRWARVISWSNSEDMKVEMRYDILKIGSMGRRNDIVAAIRSNVANKFIRRHGSDFKYLLASIQPSQGVLVFLLILGVVVNTGLMIYMLNTDFFGDEERY